MRGSDCVWAAGDAIAYPVKFGGLASQQADAVAADIAARVGVTAPPAPAGLTLRGVLMTGGVPRRLGGGSPGAPPRRGPIWRPEDKVFGTYLTPYLHSRHAPAGHDESPTGMVVERVLPGPDNGEAADFPGL